MKTNWEQVLERLRAYPPQVHKMLPPCTEERIQAVQAQLGKMPDVVADMLRHFNGARLFIRTCPLVSLFGISTIPPRPILQWAADWYIDKFTTAWRSSHHRSNDWVIGMTNYGCLIVLDQDGSVKYWDTSQEIWDRNRWTFGEWLNELLREGHLYLSE